MPAATPDRLLLSGPPGSGKTTSLVDRFAGLVAAGTDPARVLFLVATRRTARSVRRRLIDRLERSVAAVPVTTVHGFAYGVLGLRYAEMEYTEPPIVLSGPEHVGWVAAMLEGERDDQWGRFAHLRGVRGFARDLASLVLRAQERLLDPDVLLESADERPGGREIAGFYGRYVNALALANRIDYAGLLAQTAHVLADGLADEERFEHVLVDDYQESTIAGEAIVTALAAHARGVWIAADPAGPVLSSRGASREPLDRAAATFELTETSLGAARRAAPIDAREFAHPGEEAEAIVDAIVTARVNDGVAWGDIAVLVRRIGVFVATLRQVLMRASVPHVVVDEGALLAEEPAVRPVVDAIRFAVRPSERDALLEPLLLSPIAGLDPYGVRRLRREARLRGVTLAALVDEPGELPADLAAAVGELRSVIDAIVERAADLPPDELFFHVWQRLRYAGELVQRDDPEARRALDAFAGFGERAARYTTTHPGATIHEFLDAVSAADFGPEPLVLTEERRPDVVRILPAHRAHGLELDTAIVADCVEGAFPTLRLRESIVSLDALVGPQRTFAERMRTHLEDERRLFALATSRARRRTLLTASRAHTARNPRTPSRYATWSQARPGDVGIGGATSAHAIAVWARRTLADATAPAGMRLAALAALPLAGATPDTWWGGREWTGGDAPLFEGEIRTSYSRLTNMDNCGLQYLYDVEMGLDPEQSFQMWLGAVIHGIVEDANNGRLPREWDAVNAALKERWDTSVFPNRAVMHRRYLDARQMLWRWFREEEPDPAFSEVAFEFPIDGAILRGKIDAVYRQDDGTVRLVDYKTGRAAPTQHETDQDLQLAAYYLALRRVPELAELGEPSRLELAYFAASDAKSITRRWLDPRKRSTYEADAAARIEGLLTRVREERFDPSPTANCRWCSFKVLCPLWPEGAEVSR